MAALTEAHQETGGPHAEEAKPPPPPRRRRLTRGGRGSVYLLTLAFLVIFNFLLPRLLPGDPISRLAATASQRQGFFSDQEARRQALEYYGLDDPLPQQFAHYVGGLVTGDLGRSIRYNAPAAQMLRERLPWTFLLGGTAVAVATVIGMLAGIHSGWRRGRGVDRRFLTLFMAIQNFPIFFLGSLLIFVFAVKLGWVPLSGARTAFSGGEGLLAQIGDVAHHLALPAALLAIQLAATQYQVMRAGMVSELGADYLLLGRAKGLEASSIKYRYAARNALLPAVTLLALQLGSVLTLTIFAERLFAYPGIGQLMFEAVEYRDYPLIQACFLAFSVLMLAMSFMADALYARLDPRTST